MSEEENGSAHHEEFQIPHQSDRYPSGTPPLSYTDNDHWYQHGSHHIYGNATPAYHPSQYAPLNVVLPNGHAMYQRSRDILGQTIAFTPSSYCPGSRFSLTIALDYDLQLWGYTVWMWYNDIPVQAELLSRSSPATPSQYTFIGQIPLLGPSYQYEVYTKYSIHDHLGNVLASRIIAHVGLNEHVDASGRPLQAATWVPSLPAQAYQTTRHGRDFAMPGQRPYYPQYQTTHSVPDPISDYHPSHGQSFEHPTLRPRRPRLQAYPHITRSNTVQPRAAAPNLLRRRFDGSRITKRYAKTPDPASKLRRNMAVTSGPGNPPLMRTSTIKSRPSGNSELPPYSMYNPKASELRLDGDLKIMAKRWTDGEKQERRRLVEFSRSQQDNIVYVSFKPVTKEERAKDGICVSCIWWEEQDETYITSVNMIELLESLVAARFTVEEKNRIRRNLEGFKPLTVSKERVTDKLDTSTLFQVIMGFSDPKPRNIEKDVKVFPWKILPKALEKIISKYSANYAAVPGSLDPDSSQSSTYDPGSSPSQMSRQHSPQLPELTHSTSQPAFASPYTRRPRPLLRVDTSSSSLAETSSAPPTFRYSPTQPTGANEDSPPQAAAGSSYQYFTDPPAGPPFDEDGNTYPSTYHTSPDHLSTHHPRTYPPPAHHQPSPNLLFAAPTSSPQQSSTAEQLHQDFSFDDRSLFFPDP